MGCSPQIPQQASGGEAKGRIDGTVTDKAKKPLEDAVILLVKTTAKGPVNEILPVTNAKGQFNINDLPSGTYTLKAGLRGYKDLKKDVVVSAGKTAKVTFVLDKT